MKPAPLVSVIVPLYNNEAFVAAAIESALQQDYEPKEIVVVDDGSTDSSVRIVRSFGDRVRLLSQANQGAAAARNRALGAVKGEYVAFLDSDDLWLPGKLRAQIDHLESHPEIGMVYSGWSEWEPGPDGRFGETPGHASESPTAAIDESGSGWLYNDLLDECIVHTTTVVIRKSVADEVGPFDVALRRGQDYDYWLRVSRVTEIHKLRAVFSLYRIHDMGVTSQPHDTNYGIRALTKALDRFGRTGPDGRVTSRRDIHRIFARVWFGFGYLHLDRGDPCIARSAFLACVEHRPLWPLGWVNLLRAAHRCRRYRRSSPQAST